MGLFFKRTKPTDDLAADGVRCRATVEHADMLGRGSSQFNLSNAKAESKTLNARACLQKPIDPRVLIAAIQAFGRAPA